MSSFLPTVPKPVYNDLYESNVTAWMLKTRENSSGRHSRLISESH